MGDETIEIINEVIKGINKDWNKDEIIRYVYLKVGTLVTRNVYFFYSLGDKLEDQNLSFDELENIYYNDAIADKNQVICKSVVTLMKKILDILGIKSRIIKTTEVYQTYEKESNKLDIYHYLLCATGEKQKSYFMSLIPDLYRIQYNMQTKFFGTSFNYYKTINGKTIQTYEGEEIKEYIMPNEEIEALDRKIGYVKNESCYDDIFIELIKKVMVQKGEYFNHLARETEFYKSIKSYKIKGLTIDEYLNNGDINIDELSDWFNFTIELVIQKFSKESIEYKDISGKLETLKNAIARHDAKKYNLIIDLISSKFIDPRYKNNNGYCSSEYLYMKLKTLFPLIFDCNNENLKPITGNFNGFAEQLNFIDLILENLFAELREKNANQGININPSLSLVRNRINRSSILNRQTNEFSVLFNITGTEYYFLFNPTTGKFKEINDLFKLLSKDNIIINESLKNKIDLENENLSY